MADFSRFGADLLSEAEHFLYLADLTHKVAHFSS